MADLKTTIQQASKKPQSGLRSALVQGTSGTPTLGRTSQEELQKLAAQSGRPLPPTDPTTAQQLGATPQQAAMAGSSANLKSTLQLAASGGAAPPTLQETLRTEQARTQKSASELQQEQLAARLQAGTQQATSEDVGAGVHNKFENMSVDEIKLALSEDNAWLQTSANEKQQNSLAKVLRGQGSTDDIYNIASIKGPDGQNIVSFEDDGLDTMASKLTNIFGGTQEAVINAATGAVENYEDFNVLDFYVDDEGNVDEAAIEELAAALGTDRDSITSMNLGELQSALAANIEEEYSRTEDLVRSASSDLLSPMERAQARKTLKDLGATGVIATEESDVDKVADAAASADVIKVGDQDMTVAEVLGDEYLTGLISNYLEVGDRASREAIQALGEGGLMRFVDENKSALEKMVQQVDNTVKSFADIQTHNKQEYSDLRRIVGESIAKEFAGRAGNEGFTSLSKSKQDVPLLDHTALATQVVAGMGDNNIKREFLDAPKQVLDKWDLYLRSNPGKIQEFKDSNDFKNNIQKAQSVGMSPEDAAKNILGIDINHLRNKKYLADLGLLPLSGEENRTMGALLDGSRNLRSDWMDNALVNSANSINDVDRDNYTPSKLKSGESRWSPDAQGTAAKALLDVGGLNPDGTMNESGITKLSLDQLDSMVGKVPMDIEKAKQVHGPDYMNREGNQNVENTLSEYGLSGLNPNNISTSEGLSRVLDDAQRAYKDVRYGGKIDGSGIKGSLMKESALNKLDSLISQLKARRAQVSVPRWEVRGGF